MGKCHPAGVKLFETLNYSINISPLRGLEDWDLNLILQKCHPAGVFGDWTIKLIL